MGYFPELYLVTRAYQTRHGNGPMTNENIPHNISINPSETNVLNEYQGEFRRSLLDVDLLEYAIGKDLFIKDNKRKTLVITCLDHVVDEWRFTYKDELIVSISEGEFIRRISSILGIPDVLISSTNDAKNIKVF